jgi:vitamin K-dependent gamma-carboxylase
LRTWLAAPVSLGSLAVFRIALGLILLWEVVRYFSKGWIQEFFVAPDFAFAYPGFGWVVAWPEPGMTFHFVALGLLATSLALGVAARACSAGLAIGLLYVFLLDQTRYLNHFYLVILLCLLMSVTDAGRHLSLGARLGGKAPRLTAPRWQLVLLRTQLAIVYLHAGLSKLNTDWLAGEPMRIWLARRAHFPALGPALSSEPAAWWFSYGGLAFDLLVVPALLYRRTRPLAVVASLGFHGLNAWLFTIGIFPWLMIAATTLFLSPDWPRRLVERMGRASRTGSRTTASRDPAPVVSKWLVAALGLYLAIQLAVPLRHHLYPGWVHWTEEGHRFSWRMMLREKSAAGVFVVMTQAGDPIGVVNPREELPRWQLKPMLFDPQLIRQFAQHIGQRIREREQRDVAVYSRVTVSLNGRPREYLVDPDVDLAREPWRWRHASWIRRLLD